VEVDVEVHMAKGDAEMKSSNVDIKAKLSVWSGIALMALSLSSGRPVLAAEDIKLWHVSEKPAEQTLLLHLDTETKKSEAVDLILEKDEKKAQESLEKFVKTYKNEPIQFIEGIKEAWTKVDKADKTEKKDEVAKFKENLEKALAKIDKKEFEGKVRKDQLLKLVSELFKGKLDDKELVKELFQEQSILANLKLTDKEPKKEAKKEEEEKKVENKDKDVKKDATAPPVKEAVEATKPAVGEVGDDAQDRARAQQICDQIKGRQSAREAELQNLMNMANQVLNSRAAESSINPAAIQNKKNEKGLDEILPGLLANALGQQDKQDEIAPAPNNNQPFVPSNNRTNQTDPSAFNQPLPQQDQPQQPPPFFLPPNTNPGVQTPVRLDLPSSSGQQELRDAQQVTAENESRNPVSATLNQYSTFQQIQQAQLKVKGDLNKTKIALANAKDRAAKLDEQLEELKEGGRAALAPEVKKQQAQLQQDVDTAKRNYDQQRQMLMMVAPEQRDQLQGMLQSIQQDLNFKEQKLSQYNANVDAAIEDGSKQIKKLAKVRDSLNSEVNKLNTQVANIKEDDQAITNLIQNQQQMQMMQMQGAGGVQNVNNGSKLQGFSANSGLPRSQAPSRLGGILGNINNGVRGPLGK
jgi:hypothetical protein